MRDLKNLLIYNKPVSAANVYLGQEPAIERTNTGPAPK